jgi:glyoxylase-like metal-dependent hydrolase (beta-lactamase superfamily II)
VQNYICKTCGVQHAASENPPERCVICVDERQYIGWGGQQWTALAELREAGYTNDLREHEPGLTGIGTRPHFGIGQRALLLQTPAGNVLWDCISFIDDATVEAVQALGGIQALAVSHPHFYGSIIEWSHAFGGAPVYLPEADRDFVTRPDGVIEYWSGAVELSPGVTLIQTGGHFDGSAVIHWAAGAEGRGALLTGDSIAPSQDRRFVSFMWSYPNFLPMNATKIRGILESVRPYAFDRIYGGWWPTIVDHDAKAAIERSAERYIKLIQD